jgi:acyl dehydratase
MAIDSQAIKELENQIGVEWQPLVYEVEKGMIRRFAQAVGDPNPLWQDEDYAEKTGYGGVIAPPTFILTLGFDQLQQVLPLGSSLAVLHGSTELECYQPVRPGDVITVTTKIKNVRERQSKMGRTVFITLNIDYKNQKQETVAVCRQMLIIY